jgi:hypothetical protein
MIFFLMCVLIACNAVPDRGANSEYTQEVSSQIECPEVIPTSKPKPGFLEWVYPDGNISKAEYDKSIQLPESGIVEVGGIQAVVSADGVDQSLLTNIQRNRGDLLAKRIDLSVDGAIVQKESEFIIDGFEPHGPFVFNWTLTLDMGVHSASLVFDLHTGETKEYSWNFCITP